MKRSRPIVAGCAALIVLSGLWSCSPDTSEGDSEQTAVLQETRASAPTCSDYRAGRKNLYWGDLHIHTSYSMDAYNFGNRMDPSQALAFARGEELTLADGVTRKLDRPLDFAGVTDHSETYNILYICTDPGYRDSPYCDSLRLKSSAAGNFTAFDDLFLPIILPQTRPAMCTEGEDCVAANLNQWQRVQRHANDANRPCEFTSFVGIEWSASPGLLHWHRNLIFKSQAVPEHPINAIDQPTVADLWRALERECRAEDGCEVLAIPHNVNLGEGGPFAIETESADVLGLRARYEKLLEIHQHKGASECLHGFGDDEPADCDFEIFLPIPTRVKLAEKGPEALTEDDWRRAQRGYARNLLLRGLVMYAGSESPGFNPLQLGFIGSTDTHASRPGDVVERNWVGHLPDAAPGRQRTQIADSNPGGLVAVWAEQNTRASVFEGLSRRETYATSGPRIQVRFHQTWNAAADLCQADAEGVLESAMGDTVAAPSVGARPRFVVNALMDRQLLQRVDLVKLSVSGGEPRVEVFPFEAESALGDSSMCIAWSDASFDPGTPALWYARVLEIPTARWSKLDCEALGDCAVHPEQDKMIQERAWTSPIWYLP